MVWPVIAFQRAATADCTAMPPPTTYSTFEKSTVPIFGWLFSALNSVLTPAKLVNRVRLRVFTKPSRSRGLGIKRLQPPSRKKNRKQAVSAKMW